MKMKIKSRKRILDSLDVLTKVFEIKFVANLRFRQARKVVGDLMINKSELKSKYHDIDTSVRIGKNGLSESIIDEINGQFENRETKAIKVELRNSGTYSSDKGREEIAEEIARKTNSELIEIRGKKFILYKP